MNVDTSKINQNSVGFDNMFPVFADKIELTNNESFKEAILENMYIVRAVPAKITAPSFEQALSAYWKLITNAFDVAKTSIYQTFNSLSTNTSGNNTTDSFNTDISSEKNAIQKMMFKNYPYLTNNNMESEKKTNQTQDEKITSFLFDNMGLGFKKDKIDEEFIFGLLPSSNSLSSMTNFDSSPGWEGARSLLPLLGKMLDFFDLNTGRNWVSLIHKMMNFYISDIIIGGKFKTIQNISTRDSNALNFEIVLINDTKERITENLNLINNLRTRCMVYSIPSIKGVVSTWNPPDLWNVEVCTATFDDSKENKYTTESINDFLNGNIIMKKFFMCTLTFSLSPIGNFKRFDNNNSSTTVIPDAWKISFNFHSLLPTLKNLYNEDLVNFWNKIK